MKTSIKGENSQGSEAVKDKMNRRVEGIEKCVQEKETTHKKKKIGQKTMKKVSTELEIKKKIE